MPTALFLSPHLDDAVFSCGGLLALLADQGWRTVLATAFTRSVVPATGFALACQLDKGLSPDVDYMQLRRDEDRAAAALLGTAELRWLDLLEAPHRGYQSAAALFATLHPGDTVAGPLGTAFAALAHECNADLVLAPQGLGNHVDHQQVIHAAQHCFARSRLAFYRDTPYAIRQPSAQPLQAVPSGPVVSVAIGPVLARKLAAAQAYASQIGFQFGSADALATSLAGFARSEGRGTAAENFIGAALQEIRVGSILS